jgi:hypothetical protein
VIALLGAVLETPAGRRVEELRFGYRSPVDLDQTDGNPGALTTAEAALMLQAMAQARAGQESALATISLDGEVRNDLEGVAAESCGGLPTNEAGWHERFKEESDLGKQRVNLLRAQQRLVWGMALGDSRLASHAPTSDLDYELGVVVIRLAMEGSRFREYPEAITLSRTASGTPVGDAARAAAVHEARLALRECSLNPNTTAATCAALAQAEKFREELAEEIHAVETLLAKVVEQEGANVHAVLASGELEQVVVALHKYDGWAPHLPQAAGWMAKLNEEAGALLDAAGGAPEPRPEPSAEEAEPRPEQEPKRGGGRSRSQSC